MTSPTATKTQTALIEQMRAYLEGQDPGQCSGGMYNRDIRVLIAEAEECEPCAELLSAAKRLSILADQIWVKMSDEENRLMREAWSAMDAAIAKAEGRAP